MAKHPSTPVSASRMPIRSVQNRRDTARVTNQIKQLVGLIILDGQKHAIPPGIAMMGCLEFMALTIVANFSEPEIDAELARLHATLEDRVRELLVAAPTRLKSRAPKGGPRG